VLLENDKVLYSINNKINIEECIFGSLLCINDIQGDKAVSAIHEGFECEVWYSGLNCK
jgi:hypothetical protein